MPPLPATAGSAAPLAVRCSRSAAAVQTPLLRLLSTWFPGTRHHSGRAHGVYGATDVFCAPAPNSSGGLPTHGEDDQQGGGAGSRRCRFRLPANFECMPTVACASPEMLDSLALAQLVAHARDATLRWQIHHPPFWESLLPRLHAARYDLRFVDAVRLMVVFSRLPRVSMELIDHCEMLVSAPDNAGRMVELKEAELEMLAAALARMGRGAAMDGVLRPLVSRAHRLGPEACVRMLRSASACGPHRPAADNGFEENSGDERGSGGPAVGRCGTDAAGDLMEASAQAALDADPACNALTLLSLCQVAGELALQGRCQAGPATMVRRMFAHTARRALSADNADAFGLHIADLARAADRAGCLTPALRDASKANPGEHAAGA